MKQYLMALDQGTTSSRCVIFDTCGNVVAKHGIEFAQHYPAPAWVEHDPEDIWQTQLSAAREALSMAGLCATDIAAIGITNQRETTIVWEKKSGKPIAAAIPKHKSCLLVRLKSTLDLTFVKSLGTLT